MKVQNPPERLAKPMQWNGWQFRSQAEAYAAMFLTKLGVSFQYEPEAYALDGGEPTRPDFWLPDLNAWLEIKGSDTFDDRQVRRLSEAQASVTLYVAIAPLWVRASNGRNTRNLLVYNRGERVDHRYEFCRCARCRQWTIQYLGYQSRHDCGRTNNFGRDAAFAQHVNEFEVETRELMTRVGEECERFRVWSTVGR